MPKMNLTIDIYGEGTKMACRDCGEWRECWRQEFVSDIGNLGFRLPVPFWICQDCTTRRYQKDDPDVIVAVHRAAKTVITWE